MKITIAIDSFKGSLSSMEAGSAVADGILRAFPKAEIQVRPLADGGEGTAQALTAGLGGETRALTVTGPLGRPVSASYGILPNRQMAVMEMASAAGTAIHTPVTPMIRGSRSSPAMRKPKVRAKEMAAEVRPSDRAVKRAEAKMFTPEKRKVGEKR